ncbi:hypothetical protein C8F04DRAFT_1128250 [Mycena alexandri]|uniref:TEA domain-containing protein n=1 Tax=Mycena alexandri TaxID=1745969 RepID=A0AAD6SEY7_9AGAR|nr:hypothetical protein C8F04DRAFT_1128250 [Mycena alexandri]
MSWSQRYTSPSTSSSYSSTPSSPSSERSPALVSKLTWPNLQSQTTEDVLQSVIRVRKTWKTFRGGETVWPLELEAALLEGLEQYQPDDSRETRMLGRYPRRNRFISDYIFEKTGKRRSAKQVGSRLQQLRESCGGKQLLHLLSPFRKPAYSESAGSIDSALNSPTLSSEDGIFPSTSSRHTVMYIDLLPDESRNNICGADGSSPWSDTGDIVRASDHPRRLESINPTISFTSPSRIFAHSQFTVYSESLILHAETVPLVPLVNDSSEATGFLYSTGLVPKYWKVILDSPDPTRFTIFQEVVKEENSAILFSATYKFSYPPANSCSSQYDPNFGYTAARLDTSSSDGTTYHGHSSLPSTRYPVYENPPWTLPTLRREPSPAENYSSPDSDPSVLCFPGELSNMYP